MNRAEFLEKCEKFKIILLGDASVDSREDICLEAFAAEKNEFFTPGNLNFAKSALKEVFLSSESLNAFLDEVERVYGASFEEVREKNKGLQIGVIMAGNIPGVGFSDLFCTLALGFTAVVKLSSKDSYFMWGLMQKLLKSFSEFSARTTDNMLEEASLGNLAGVVFAGSDQTKAQIERELKGIPLLARGTKFSFGIVDEIPTHIEQLVYDAFLYFGLGCRSLTYLFVPKGFNWTEFLNKASELFKDELLCCASWKNSLSRQRAIAKLGGRKIYNFNCAKKEFCIDDGGEYVIDAGFVLLNKTNEPFPPLGVLNFQEYDRSESGEIEKIREFEKKYGEQIQKKYTKFGMAQLPSLTDWQDGISTIVWLKYISLK